MRGVGAIFRNTKPSAWNGFHSGNAPVSFFTDERIVETARTGVLFSVPKCMEFTNMATKRVGMEHERSTKGFVF